MPRVAAMPRAAAERRAVVHRATLNIINNGLTKRVLAPPFLNID
jgi:hypothetical protein